MYMYVGNSSRNIHGEIFKKNYFFTSIFFKYFIMICNMTPRPEKAPPPQKIPKKAFLPILFRKSRVHKLGLLM